MTNESQSREATKLYTEEEVRAMFHRAAEMVKPIITREAEASKVTGELLNFRVGQAAIQFAGRESGGVCEDAIELVITNKLNCHRLQDHFIEGTDKHLSLVDRLSPGPTIKEGREEIDRIAEMLTDAIIAMQPPAKTVQGLGEDEAVEIIAKYLGRDCSAHRRTAKRIAVALLAVGGVQGETIMEQQSGATDTSAIAQLTNGGVGIPLAPEPTQEEIERVAMALNISEYAGTKYGAPDWESLGEETKADKIADAKAAIQAMRKA